MQELLEWVRATLPMDLDTPQMIEAKIESLLKYEEKIIKQSYYDGIVCSISHQDDDMLQLSKEYYNETFKAKQP